MVVEINLLEQKDKRNILPFIILGLLAIVLCIIFLYFNVQRSNLAEESSSLQSEIEQIQAKQDELNDRSSDGGSSREVLAQSVEDLQSSLIPAIPLVSELVSLLPERGFFDSFTLTSSTEVALVVRFDTLQEVAQFTNSLEQQEFVTSVELSSVEAEVVDDTADPYDFEPRHIANYFVTLDESFLRSEGVDRE